MLINDRRITISAAGSRRATRWPAQVIYWSELVAKVSTPTRGTETLAEYLRLPKSRQDDLKDVGGFVGGALAGERRKSNTVTGRDVVTLDLDNIPSGGTEDALRRLEGLGCAYAVYSTRKHEPVKPRLRVLIPLGRTATADEYEPLARRLAAVIDIALCDPSTFEASRLMYWPSCCTDSQYVYRYGDKPFVDVDGVLGMYANWRNIAEWPEVPGVQNTHVRLAAKQGAPTDKPGIVGAFCKVYNIYQAMDTFLPGVYAPCDHMPGRYTFAGGSTAGGAVIYDSGSFLFSHHATDPASGRLVNSFDLVRLHRFDGQDDEVAPGTPTNRLPSFTAMCALATADSSVATLLTQERYEQATADFGQTLEDNANWISKLAVSQATGTPAKTIDNILLILEHDPLLKGKIAYDEFACRRVIFGELPWNKSAERRPWQDEDDAGARHYFEKAYQITGVNKITDGVALCASKNRFDDVRRYLTGLVWDGVRRLDTLLIDYLGAADTAYTRAVTRKAFTAAVARTMMPGCKFDTMTILTGPQGIGKTSLLKKMGRTWFSDSIKTFEGKEASELIQGVWIVELGELEAFNRSEIGRIKQFLSQQEDIFRAAYGHHVGWYPRRCVFFGTSNNSEYLRDRTGGRRFWPIDVGIHSCTKSVFNDLEAEVDQLWAEAFVRWQVGEPLYLSGELEQAARDEQEAHRERSAHEGVIRDFVAREVPEDWLKWPLDRRRMYWSSGIVNEVVTAERSRICALEVWCEALGGDVKQIKYNDTAEINGVIASMGGWKRQKNGARHGYCGLQRGFER